MSATSTEALRTAVDLANLAYDALLDLEALFLAISRESDEHTQARRLASIGQYLSCDWAHTIDCQRPTLSEALAVSKGTA